MDNVKIKCKGCGKIKDSDEFYFADGGLGEIKDIADVKCELCKDCVKYYNDNNCKRTSADNYKYLGWQRISCYFAVKMGKTARYIQNGMLNSNSKVEAIANFKFLFTKCKGLSHTSKQQKNIFNALHNKSGESLKNAVKEILTEDYETFKKFKQRKTK